MLQKIICCCCGEAMVCCDNPLRFYDVGNDRIATCIICGMSFQETTPIHRSEFRLEHDPKVFGLKRVIE